MPTIHKPHGLGAPRTAREHHPAHHGAGLGVRDDRQDTGTAGHLRLPQPQGPHVRRLVDRDVGRRQGTDGLGPHRGARRQVAPDRGAARLSAEARRGMADLVLPHTSVGHELHGARRAPGRGGGGARLGALHLRHPELPREGVGVRPGAGVRDDEAQVPGRAPADQEQAVGLLHDGRDGPGPAPARLLAVLGPASPEIRARESVRDRVPGLLPLPRLRGGIAHRVDPRRRGDDRHVRPRRPPDGGRRLHQRLAHPGGLSHAVENASTVSSPSRRRRSTGAGRWRGATAATTAGCS